MWGLSETDINNDCVSLLAMFRLTATLWRGNGAKLQFMKSFILPLACLCGSSVVSAQIPADVTQPTSAIAGAGAAASPEDASAPGSQVIIPALTVVSIEILATIGSKTSTTGETFPLRLAQPIIIDGKEVVPAGVTGMGEIIHAKKSGGSGAGGELVLAARYLDLDGRRLRLRSMQVSAAGKDQMELALLSAQAIGPIAFAITGKNIEIAKGRIAAAKTAEAFVLTSTTPVSSPVAGAQPQ